MRADGRVPYSIRADGFKTLKMHTKKLGKDGFSAKAEIFGWHQDNRTGNRRFRYVGS